MVGSTWGRSGYPGIQAAPQKCPGWRFPACRGPADLATWFGHLPERAFEFPGSPPEGGKWNGLAVLWQLSFLVKPQALAVQPRALADSPGYKHPPAVSDLCPALHCRRRTCPHYWNRIPWRWPIWARPSVHRAVRQPVLFSWKLYPRWSKDQPAAAMGGVLPPQIEPYRSGRWGLLLPRQSSRKGQKTWARDYTFGPSWSASQPRLESGYLILFRRRPPLESPLFPNVEKAKE